MKKIISLFQRNYDTNNYVRDEVTLGAEWVLEGKGIATRKWDGTCCMVKGGVLYKRYDAKTFTVNKATQEKIPWNRKPPEGFIPAQDADPITGHWPGWLAVSETDSSDRWHREAFTKWHPDGTYELCGPKVNGNRDAFLKHVLILHGVDTLPDCPRNFDGIKAFLGPLEIEGIVFHHSDGRMVKIKRRDFDYGHGA
jgi:hypothetical protein